MPKLVQRLGAAGVGLAAVLVLAVMFFGFNQVDAYEVAVKKNAITKKLDPKPYHQGLYHSILRSWTTYSTREVQYPSQGNSERLVALTSDQLQIGVDASFRYRIDPDSVVELYLNVGAQPDVHSFVYNAYRSAVRDAISEVAAADILSKERAGIAERIRNLMEDRLTPRGISVTEFFVREIEPPETIRKAIEAKLAREQQVQAEHFQTQVVEEQANQKRAEAQGIRDAQGVIATSLTGVSGQRYLYWRYLEMLGEVAKGQNNMVIAPTEGGIPIFFTPNKGQ